MLTDVFGPGKSADVSSRARESSRIFVRGLDLLTIDSSSKATGRRLTAAEAYGAYGFEKLYEVVREGSAIISDSPAAAGRVLHQRRTQLELPIRTVAAKSELPPSVVEALEQSARRPVREYERVARVLGLDERALSFKPVPEGNERVAVRLRSLAEERPTLSPSSVASLAEAAWVAMTQIRLERQLDLTRTDYNLQPSDDYGYPGYPPYRVGYDLADTFRSSLGLGDAPIPSVRRLIEADLGIPVIQAQLSEYVAGATVESDEKRAIVLNIEGLNRNALIRRSTATHELGHLLFDPTQNLRDLRVDDYIELEERPDTRTDPVEQRANAFAVQLLAPQEPALERYNRTGDLFNEVLDYYGIGFTAGRYQIWNALQRSVDLDEIRAPSSRRPEPDWEAREGYTLTYHPLRSLANRPSRAGRFSAVAIRCAQLGIVSWDTVSEWLYCSPEDARESAATLADFYPEVFTNG
jgi:Zn-dependent peptidase ImmA (M78 family)